MRLLSATATFVLLAVSISAEEPQSKAQRINLLVSETAGIRRFGYPVSVIIPLPEPIKSVDDFRLLSGDKPVSGQFRPHGDTSKGIRSVNLDFNASPGPLKREEYVVEYGSGVSAPKPKSGLRVETTEKEFRVIHPSDLEFQVSRDAAAVLSQVRAGKTEFMKPESNGLLLRTKGSGVDYLKVGNPRASKVLKQGPLAVTLEFRGEKLFSLRNVFDPLTDVEFPSVVQLEFPISKSWIRVDWTVEDRDGNILSLGAEWNLNLEGEPTLVDWGAGTSVYAQLRRGETMRLRQNPAERPAGLPRWETFLGSGRDLKPFVVSPGSTTLPTRDAEGWAHIMDRERCTAVAVANFAAGREGAEITVEADGRLRIWRHFGKTGAASKPGDKRLTFWLHFVGMPVHVGAATSPQAMLAPLQVEIVKKP
jgi:hypothetical protein